MIHTGENAEPRSHSRILMLFLTKQHPIQVAAVTFGTGSQLKIRRYCTVRSVTSDWDDVGSDVKISDLSA